MTDNKLWTEKYRPRTAADYVWRDPVLKQKVEQWVADRAIPHVLFSGDPGVGKTSLAYLILSLLNIPQEDILYIPASRQRKVDEIMNSIGNFVGLWTHWENDTGKKYVILDEADSISKGAQKALRADMEVYEDSCRFILTANYPNMILDALHSRVEHYHFSRLDEEAFSHRLFAILSAEDVDVENTANLEAMLKIQDRCYPDLRKAIGTMQQGCLLDETGRRYLRAPAVTEMADTKPFLVKATTLIKQGHLRDARQLIVQSAQVDEYPSIFKWLYQNLDLWGQTTDQQDSALLAIRAGLVHHAVIADPEINLSATLCQLAMIWATTK